MEKDEYMKKYQEKVEKLNENKEFTSFLTHEQDIRFQLNSERLEGKREGEAIGEKRGEKRGKKLGERNSKIEIAHNLLKENMEISMISKVTGLSIETIKDLQKN